MISQTRLYFLNDSIQHKQRRFERLFYFQIFLTYTNTYYNLRYFTVTSIYIHVYMVTFKFTVL